MIISDRTAARAAFAVGLFSVASIASGVALLAMLGGTSGQDLGQGAAAEAFARAVPVLIAAEALKLLSAAAQLLVVAATAHKTITPRAWVLAGLGSVGSLGFAASGVFGLAAIAAARPEVPPIIAQAGFLGIAVTGGWALLTAWWRVAGIGGWLRIVGLLFGAGCLLALALPPLAILSGLVGLVWWFGLASHLRRLGRAAGEQPRGIGAHV